MKPCEKSVLKYFRLFILAYQFIETFGLNSAFPKDFGNSIIFFNFFYFFFPSPKALYTLINSFYILE